MANEVFNYLSHLDHYYCCLLSQNIWSQKSIDKLLEEPVCGSDEFKDKQYSYVCLTTVPVKVAVNLHRPLGIKFDESKVKAYIESIGGLYLPYEDLKYRLSFSKTGTDPKHDNAFRVKGNKPNATNTNKLVAAFKCSNNTQVLCVDDFHPIVIHNAEKFNEVIDLIHRAAHKSKILHLTKQDIQSADIQRGFLYDQNKNRISWQSQNGKDLEYFPYLVKPKSNYLNLDIQECWLLNAPEGVTDLGFAVANGEGKKLSSGTGYFVNVWANNLDDTDCDLIGGGKLVRPSIDPRRSTDTTNQYHVLLPDDIVSELLEVANENEIRLYIPKHKDFYFTLDMISALELPKVVKISRATLDKKLNLEKLYKACTRSANSKTRAFDSLDYLSSFAKDVLENLMTLITAKYSSIPINWYDAEVSLTDEYFDKPNNKDSEPDSDILGFKDHRRYLDLQSAGVSEPQMRRWEDFDVKDHLIVKYRGKYARLGVECIITANDSEGNKYLLLEDKSRKGYGFLELPGGGFVDLESAKSSQQRTKRMVSKLKMELPEQISKNITNVRSTNIGMWMSELGISKSELTKQAQQGIGWEASYYYIYKADYNGQVDPSDREFDNRENEGGEFLRWIPLKELKYQYSFMDRYSALWKLIENDGNNYKRDLGVKPRK